jgi:hypothetical protein
MTFSINMLGGKVNGLSVPGGSTSTHTADRAMMRKKLTRSWNTKYARGVYKGKNRVITPFRAVTNSGDFLARQNYSCGGPNPSHRAPGGIRSRFGSMLSNCDGTGIEASSTNVKYVYDSSDFMYYKKQVVMNRNYNDDAK